MKIKDLKEALAKFDENDEINSAILTQNDKLLQEIKSLKHIIQNIDARQSASEHKYWKYSHL